MKKLIRFIIAVILALPLFIIAVPIWAFLDWITCEVYVWKGSNTYKIILEWKNLLTFGEI